jgi:DNA-binding MltR family transcriptional regulator
MASKGKPKPKVRDLITKSPSKEEISALKEAFLNGEPMVTAILAQSLLEHQLEILLRLRFKRKDDSTWGRVTSEHGPLQTFSAKIIAGYAFGLYDEATMRNLNIIREIRNAFAHAKHTFDFTEAVIVSALENAELPKAKTSRRHRFIYYLKQDAKKYPKEAFIILCQELDIELLKCESRSYRASVRNRTRRRPGRPANALFGMFGTSPRYTGMLSSLLNQIDDPSSQESQQPHSKSHPKSDRK